MLEPSETNPLPWRKQNIFKASITRDTTMMLWAIVDADGVEVCRLNDFVGGEKTADFIVAMANASTYIVWMEIDSERARRQAAS